MFQPADFAAAISCVVKKKKREKRKKWQCFALRELFEQMCCGMPVCRKKEGFEQSGLKGNKGFQMSPAYSAALPAPKLEAIKVWW